MRYTEYPGKANTRCIIIYWAPFHSLGWLHLPASISLFKHFGQYEQGAKPCYAFHVPFFVP